MRRPNPFVFIVGCPRSGTTLLRRIVDAHPQLAITPETQWIPAYYKKRLGLTPEGLVTPELIPRLLEHRKFFQLQLSREELERLITLPQPVPYASFVTGIFDLYGKIRGKSLVGDKTSGYVLKLRMLHDLWPTAKFVHLIRDGRDVCLSILNWTKANRAAGRYATWAEDPITTTALWWKRTVQLGCADGRLLEPDLYYELHLNATTGVSPTPMYECAYRTRSSPGP